MLNRSLKCALATSLAVGLVAGAYAGEPWPYRADSVQVLQSKADGQIKGQHYLAVTPETAIWGRLPTRKTPMIMTVESGSTVTFDSLSHEGILEDQGKDPVKYFAKFGIKENAVLKDAAAVAKSSLPHDFDKDGPHVVSKPIAIKGAKPGDVLKIEVLEVTPRVPYGVITNRHYKGSLVGEFPENSPRLDNPSPQQPERYGNVSVFSPIKRIDGKWYGFHKLGNKEIRFPISPFLGIMGITPDTDEAISSVPPGRYGGNVDINEQGIGVTMYLPVEVEGAGFYVSDPHFVQGDGEVALTALEGSLRATVRLTVLPKGSAAIPKTNSDNLVSPFMETENYWIPIGLNRDLDEAMKMAVRETISFLSKQLGIERKQVYAYLSAGADYEVSQVVDGVKGIHGMIPKVDFADWLNLKLNAGGKSFKVSIINDKLYVPASQVASALKLNYSEDKGRITAGPVKMAVDSNKYVKGKDTVYLEVAPVSQGGTVMLPVSVLHELMGASVNWATEGTTIVGTAQVL